MGNAGFSQLQLDRYSRQIRLDGFGLVRVVGQYVSDANVQSVVGGADLIADGAPLFEERYTLNRAAVAAKVPLVSRGDV